MAKKIMFNLFKRKVIINMPNRSFYSLIAFGIITLFVTGFFVVNALTPGVAPNPGHLITQVAPPAGCGDGQVLQFIDEDNGWGCVSVQRELGVYDCGEKAITKIDFTTGTVTCKDVTGVTSVQFDLVYGIHSSTQCTNLGGTVVTDGADKFCRFASCPAGWIQFKSWSTTRARTCESARPYCDLDQGEYNCRCYGSCDCTTGSHSFSNKVVEQCYYNKQTCVRGGDYSPCSTTAVCSATRIQKGCY